MPNSASVPARYTRDAWTSQRVHQNRLLASLPDEEFDQLRPHLIPDPLEYKAPLYEANEPIEFVHFIETGVASIVNTMLNGDAAEVGTIGNEGMVGLPIVLGDKQAPTSVYMQVAGASLKMKAKLFREVMQRNPSMQRVMLHYGQAFLNQVAQSAACNTFHSLEQRCSRWLLMTHDRMESNDFPLTQEFLAMMLGVRRAGVTIAANALRRAGLIDYTRGRITILNLAGLLRRTCECYSVTKREFNRLFGVVSASAPRSGKSSVGYPLPNN